MTVNFSEFLQLTMDPMIAVTALLTLGVILVNGWTDAPNAIATCVSTRAMKPKAAILMAAVFNFFGVFVMTLFNAKVAATIYNMVDFAGSHNCSLRGTCRHCGLGDACVEIRHTDK